MKVMTRSIILFFLLLSLIFSCANSKQNNDGEGMAQFVEDEEFKAAHDEPKDVNLEEKGKNITFKTSDDSTATAYAIIHEAPTTKFLLVIHEWWGLNDQIKQEAERLFNELDQVNVLALDMYDGKVADNRKDAGKYMQSMKQERGEAIVKGALAYIGTDAKVATIGWCFGGGWSLKSSIIAADQGAACIMYYGMPVQDQSALMPLKADILGIFAKQDAWITPEVADNFKSLAEQAGKSIEIHQFDANHAFANPSSEAYVEEAAQTANQLALAFLKERL